MALVVMLNNLLHDFSVAMLFCSMLAMILIRREINREREAKSRKALGRTYHKLRTVMLWSLAFIVLFGIGRTLAYSRYEWHEAAASGQVLALAVKHVILGGIVLAGVVFLLKGRKSYL